MTSAIPRFADTLWRSMTTKKFVHDESLRTLLPSFEAEDRPDGRFYDTPVGWLPSVTTVLSRSEDFAWYQEWVDRVGKEEADRVSRAGADRGTYVHDMVRCYLGNQDIHKVDHPPSYYWMFRRILSFLNRIDHVLLQEWPVYNERLRYAGRLDLLATFDGKMSLIDFKTYARPKDHHQLLTAFTQAEMYAEALEAEMESVLGFMPFRVEQLVIIFAAEKELSDVRIETDRKGLRADVERRVAIYHGDKK